MSTEEQTEATEAPETTETPEEVSYGVTADNPWSGKVYVPDLGLEVSVPSVSAIPELVRVAIAKHLKMDDVSLVRFHLVQSQPDHTDEDGPEDGVWPA